jgi:uncharacterized integral membrane protein
MRAQCVPSEPPLATAAQLPPAPQRDLLVVPAEPDLLVVPTPPSAGALAPPAPSMAPEKVPSTRVGRVWNGVVPVLVLLALILVFVFQNLHKARVKFITVSGTLPLGVALLAAAAFGGLLVLALGSARMVQLRKALRRHNRAEANATLGGRR